MPGSSDVFLGAIVAYSNEVKAAQLGVPEEVLAEHGAVSEETAAAMAQGARARARRGRGGRRSPALRARAAAREEKPVGLVYLHAAGPAGELGRRLDFPGDRETIRLRAAVSALHLVRRLVTES